MDALASMAVFVCVAEQGAFVLAAEVLQISTTMVANHVRSLESRLDARLIERTTRRITLTTVGAAYLERCREVLALVEAADRIPEAIHAVAQGSLRVTAPIAYGNHRLVPVVAAFMEAYPQVRVDLMLDDRLVDLFVEGYDIGVRIGPLVDTSVVARRLQSSRMHAVASPRYLASHGTPERPSDLSQHNCVGSLDTGFDAQWCFTQDETSVTIPVRGRFCTNDGQALLNAALAGVGIVVQADILVAPQATAGELVHVLPEWELPIRAAHLVYRHEGTASAKVRHFVDFAVARLGA